MSILPAPGVGAAAAFVQVVMIDLALASDNAVAVGLAASGLPERQRRRAIVLGLACAVALLVGFALITVQLLQMVGLLLAGGLLLMWVCWNMWGELRGHAAAAAAVASAETPTQALEGAAGDPPRRQAKTLGAALLQILVADLTMSLDNVLAVAGAARRHPQVLVAGLMISITLMGVAATWIAKLLNRYRWLGYVGLAVIFSVSLHMIWEGHRAVMIDLGHTGGYNAVMPEPLAISPVEIAARRAESQ